MIVQICLHILHLNVLFRRTGEKYALKIVNKARVKGKVREYHRAAVYSYTFCAPHPDHIRAVGKKINPHRSGAGWKVERKQNESKKSGDREGTRKWMKSFEFLHRK